MNIGIDARILERKITGIGRSLQTLLDELPLVDKENKYFLFSYEKLNLNNIFYKEVPTIKSFLPQKFFSPIWMNFILPFYLKKNKINIFFSINTLIPLIKIKTIKYVFVLHDVTCKVDKNFHPFIYRKYIQFFTYFSIKSSDLIITVSEYSKKDIFKYYNVNKDKVKVVYLAAEKSFCPLNLTTEEKEEIKKRFGLTEHIIMYLGMIENRKNILGILKVADEVLKKNKQIKFLLIGKIGYGGKKLKEEINKRENVVHLMNIGDQLLKKIYNISFAFLFPSYYEGFGYPPLEAMQSGLPVLAADNTSLKEVIGDGGILHNPDDYNSFVKDIFRLLEDESFYKQMQRNGFEKAKKFNINKTVKEFVKIFNSLK
jgi:glycosyltransferase involved in cell wall biosynthesis